MMNAVFVFENKCLYTLILHASTLANLWYRYHLTNVQNETDKEKDKSKELGQQVKRILKLWILKIRENKKRSAALCVCVNAFANDASGQFYNTLDGWQFFV